MKTLWLAIALFASTLVAPPAEAGILHRMRQQVRRQVLRTRAAIAVGIGKAIGVAEVAGLRFEVKRYQERVSEQLWRGARVDDVGLADLKRRGFVAVVGLTKERDIDKDARKIGILHKRIAILDNSTPTMAQVHDFLDFVRAQKGPVYVHCEAGVGRTGIMVAAYRMAIQGWSTGRALVEARQHGLKLRNQVEFIRALGAALHS